MIFASPGASAEILPIDTVCYYRPCIRHPQLVDGWLLRTHTMGSTIEDILAVLLYVVDRRRVCVQRQVSGRDRNHTVPV